MNLKAPLIGGLALTASIGLHVAGFAIKPSSEVRIEGGAPMQVAMLGNSFADMTEGSVDSVPQEDVTEPVEQVDQTDPVEQTDQIEPTKQINAAQPVEEPPVAAPARTDDLQPATPPDPSPAVARPDLAQTVRPVLAAPAIVESRTNPVVALIEEPVATARRPVVRPPVTSAPPPPVVTATQPPVPALITPPTQTEPAKAAEVLTALAPATPRETLRAETPIERLEAQPDTVRPVARPQKPAKPKPSPAPATRKGGDQTAKKGQADGNDAGKAATSSNQRSVTSGAAGNAAVSNYPGLVMSKIRRVRKERAGAKGKATVGFKISASGAVTSVRILRSSGSAKIDRIAVRHVQRASPFPAPPKGARRSFSVVFVSKR